MPGGLGVIRVAVVAPAMALRAGLRALLVQDPEVDVLAEGAALSELISDLKVTDVLVLAAEAVNRAELEQALAEVESFAVLVLVETEPGAVRLLTGLNLQAWGVLSLECTGEELQAAVKALNQGLLVGAASLMEPFFTRFTREGEGVDDPLVEKLTEREGQVLQLLAQGLANKQIALELGISEHTVKFHVSGIYTKLGVTNRTEAVRQGVRQGLVVL
jgi:DNA-binding NarL/FixJ family response regulator